MPQITRKIARSLIPRVDLMHVAVRDLALPIDRLPELVDVEFAPIRSEFGAGFGELVDIARFANESPESCRQNLQRGRVAWIARARAGESPEEPRIPVAVGWVATDDVYIREISGSFQGDGHSAYFYSDYVRPEFRGQRLQQHLIFHRLEDVARQGLKWACAAIHRSNIASLRSYAVQGFASVAQVNSLNALGFGLARVRVAADAPSENDCFVNWPNPGRCRNVLRTPQARRSDQIPATHAGATPVLVDTSLLAESLSLSATSSFPIHPALESDHKLSA